ncbi:hypothetical protein [Zobellella denitrificans]|jgi:hypothetical protein|uniref:hypothetical protein n=1 Tax=Zobellella denitrificans TaxID=347534 RepID=UPI0012FDA4EF|nr:hypothetical protein [Zobellella denitrificans]
MIKGKQVAHMFAFPIKKVPKLNFYAEEWGFCLKKSSADSTPTPTEDVPENPQSDNNSPWLQVRISAAGSAFIFDAAGCCRQ